MKARRVPGEGTARKGRWTMRLRWCWDAVAGFMVMVMLMAGAILLLAGCRLLPASVPSDQKGAPMVITQQQVELLGKGVDKDVQVLASALENNTDGGSVIYVDHNGYIYDAAGSVVYDKNDPPQPLRVRTKIIAKLNSLQNFANVTGVRKVKYEVGGRSYLVGLPDGLKHMDTCPVPLLLEIEGADAVGVKSPLAEQRVAAGQEREAIYAGLSKYAEARGAAFATRVASRRSSGCGKAAWASSGYSRRRSRPAACRAARSGRTAVRKLAGSAGGCGAFMWNGLPLRGGAPDQDAGPCRVTRMRSAEGGSSRRRAKLFATSALPTSSRWSRACRSARPVPVR